MISKLNTGNSKCSLIYLCIVFEYLEPKSGNVMTIFRFFLILFIVVCKHFFYFNGCSHNAKENVSNFQRHYYINLVLTFKIKDMPYIKKEREERECTGIKRRIKHKRSSIKMSILELYTNSGGPVSVTNEYDRWSWLFD